MHRNRFETAVVVSVLICAVFAARRCRAGQTAIPGRSQRQIILQITGLVDSEIVRKAVRCQ